MAFMKYTAAAPAIQTSTEAWKEAAKNKCSVCGVTFMSPEDLEKHAETCV